MILKEFLSLSSQKLESVENGDVDLRHIIKKVLSFTETDIILNKDRLLTEKEIGEINSMISKRMEGMPVQYIIGEWDFYGMSFTVNENVLIPRPETEILCEHVINLIKNRTNPCVADLCSGSGCIGITVKANKCDADVTLVEKSEKAMLCSGVNAKNLLGADKVKILSGDVLLPDSFDFSPQFDVIVSNPPYIKSEEIPTLQSEVLREPEMALDGGDDGLVFYRVIISGWGRYLKDDGIFAFECGEEQAYDIKFMLEKENFDVEILKDYNDVDRFVIGKRRKI